VRTFYQTPHWKNSDALFHHTLTINPSSFASYNNLAVAAIDERRLQEAVDLASLAVQLNPNYPEAYLTRADALRQIRGPAAAAAALADYRRVLDLDRNNAPALTNAAALLAQAGQVEQALPYAKRAVEIAPDLHDARVNLAKMYMALGDAASARREIAAVLAADPANPAALAVQAQLP
jgi:tetratricopeptide (TPR) repeat protein